MNDQVDHSRRRLLTAATVGTGVVGVAFAAVPFPGVVEAERPRQGAGRAGARSTPRSSRPGRCSRWCGAASRCSWCAGPRRSSSIWAITTRCSPIRHPTIPRSPTTSSAGAARARNPEYWVGLAVCTHLGCSPLGAFDPNNALQLAGTDLGAELAGRILLPLPRLEVRHVGPRIQEHAGTEEPHRSAVRIRRGCDSHLIGVDDAPKKA